MHLHSDKGEIEPGRRPPGPSRDPSSKGPAALVVQGKADPDAVVDLQRTVGNAAVVQLLRADDGPDDGSGDPGGAGGGASPVLDVVGKGGGQPLDAGVRTGMERALGADLSGVRIHTDGAAAASAQAVQAHAYTVGHEVVFGAASTSLARRRASERSPMSSPMSSSNAAGPSRVRRRGTASR